MKAVVSADTVSVEKRPLYYHLMRSNSLISDYSNWRDSLTAFKQGYEIIGGSEHAETFTVLSALLHQQPYFLV